MARSPDTSGVTWLRAELPRLVEQGVITAETAQALDRRYPAESKTEPSRIGFVISAILGSALLGAGVILLVAHNWDELSRPLRCAIGLVPLLASQALVFFVLVRRNGSQAWREGVAIFNIAAIGTAISLISQTYQIQGDFPRFILVWMLLALPVVYLLRTTAGLCAYLVGAMVWVISKSDHYEAKRSILWIWLMLAVAGPMLADLIRRNRKGFDALVGALLFAAATGVALGYTNDLGIHRFWGCVFAGFWAVVYLVGSDWFGEWRSRRAHPFVPIAWIAIISIVIVFSFKSGWRPSGVDFEAGRKAVALAVLIQIAWIVAGSLGILALRRKKQAEINLGPVLLTPVAVIAWFIFDATQNPLIPSLIINLFGLALGVFTLLRGVRAGRAFEANFGMLIIAALAIARFFDSEFEFVVRGIGFILIGAGFIVTNMIVSRRRTNP